MNLTTVRVLSAMMIIAGCVHPSDTWSEDGGGTGSGDDGGGSQVTGGAKTSSTTGTGSQETIEFDPCPEDRYHFLLPDGREIVIELEVFCDKRKYIETGYPTP